MGCCAENYRGGGSEQSCHGCGRSIESRAVPGLRLNLGRPTAMYGQRAQARLQPCGNSVFVLCLLWGVAWCWCLLFRLGLGGVSQHGACIHDERNREKQVDEYEYIVGVIVPAIICVA